MTTSAIRFFRTRADLALALADAPENAHLREKYLELWRDWTSKAQQRTGG